MLRKDSRKVAAVAATGLSTGRHVPGRVRAGPMSAGRCRLSGMARFEDQDLTDAEFRECDLTRARLIGVVMQDAVIDGLVSNLVVNGVEVMSYVEAELDRRHPVRPLMRSSDPADLREAERHLRASWAATVARLRGPAPGVGAPARRRRMVGGRDAAPPGLRARLVVSSLLPRITSAVHRDWVGIGLRAGPGGARPGSSGGT